MASQYAISQQEDDHVIKHRLLTRTTVTRGEPPLKKLVKKFGAFVSELEKSDGNQNDGGDQVERAAKLFLQELNSFELPLIKTRAVIEANQREQESFRELQKELEHRIHETTIEIEEKKRELEVAKIERKNKEEYEAIRKLIAAEPSRDESQAAIDQLKIDIAKLETESAAAAQTVELKKKRFEFFLQVLEDLEANPNETQILPEVYPTSLEVENGRKDSQSMAVDSI